MTKEKFRELLERCCKALETAKHIKITTADKIKIKENVWTPYDSRGTSYTYTIFYKVPDKLSSNRIHLSFYNIDTWNKTDEYIVAFSKSIIRHLWKRIKVDCPELTM